jgi:ABC-type transporter Mla subunit MlaD
MKTFVTIYDWMRRLVVLALLVGLGLAGWNFYRAIPLREMSGDLRNASYNAAATSWNLKEASGALNGKHGIRQVLYNVNVLTAQIGRTSNTLRLASVEERKHAKEAGEKAIKALGEMQALIGETNRSLNGENGVLPALTADLTKTGGLLDQVQGDDGLLAAGAATLNTAGAAIAELQPELKRAAKNVGDMTEHGNGAAAHVEKTLGYVEASFAPKKVSFWGRVAASVLPFAVRQAFSYLMPERVNVVNEVTTKPSEGK